MNPNLVFLEASGVVDASGVASSPGAVLAEFPASPDAERPLGCSILAAGDPQSVGAHEAARRAMRFSFEKEVIHPGLVNAHTHLDLTHIGPRDHDPGDGFVSWVRMILRERAREEEAIKTSVRLGVERSLAAGVVAVGDIAGVGQRAPLDALRESPLIGVSFIELFGLLEETAMSALENLATIIAERPRHARGVRLGVQPHAPYSASIHLYLACAHEAKRSGLPLSTHLAESPEEHELVETASGDFQTFLASMGVWSDDVAGSFGHGRTPVEHLREPLQQGGFLLAHLNDLASADIEALARTSSALAYCPRSSHYFGNDTSFGPHRYRELLDVGLNVCLGTDSIVNLRSGEGMPPISPLDDARFLFDSGEVDTDLLIGMVTTRGALALGLPDEWFTLQPGPCAGLAVTRAPAGSAGQDPAVRVLSGTHTRLLLGGNSRCEAGIVLHPAQQGQNGSGSRFAQ